MASERQKSWARLCFGGGLLFLVVVVIGCATYASRIVEPRRFFDMGQYDAAIAQLIPLAQKHDNDELLYLMDLALTYHSAGKYKEAIDTFLKADKLAEIKDYTSITQEAASVLLSDEVKPYKGEDFEKILINQYLAIDYTMLRQWEDALVECRQSNHKLEMMISQGGLPYELNPFAKYLSASLFESQKELNDAFVDYRWLYKNANGFPYLPRPLIRVADRLHSSEELAEYQQRYPGVKGKLGKNEGEVILLLEQGKAPVKVPHPNFHLLPKFRVQYYNSDYAWIRDGNTPNRARTYTLYDVEQTAIKQLDNRIVGITAKKIGGVVLKEVVAAEVAKQTNSKAAGLLTSLVLHAQDRADLRSWTTLPAHLQLARLVLPAGRHDLWLDMVTKPGSEISGIKRWDGVEVKPGQTVYLNTRISD